MKQSKQILILTALVSMSFTGCASLQPRQAFGEVTDEVEPRTGVRVRWNQGNDSDQAVESATRGLIAQELTVESAVQIALLNNRNLQATLEDLGIAQAELVQAGLLKNPVFSALVRFPEAGAGDANLEFSVSQNFIDLLSMPLRKRVAAAQYDAVKARVADEIVMLARDTQEAFYTAQGSAQMLEMRRSVLDATAAAVDAALRLREAGNITELALTHEQALNGQATLELALTEAQIVSHRERLLLLLGNGSLGEIKIASRLPTLPATDDEIADVESLALEQRLDLAAAKRELNATYASLGVTRQFAWFDDAEIEVEAERETDGEWITGPGVSLPIPIFDTGAARVSVARAQIRQAEHRIHAMFLQVRSQARAGKAAMRAARERVNYFQNSLLPLRQKITRQTQLQYNAMQVGVFELLQAKREEIEAGSEYIESLRDYWIARTDLERAIGGRLASPATPTTSPAAAAAPDASATSPAHQHQDQHQHQQ